MFTYASAFTFLVGIVLGFGFGFWWYRHTLKTDPAKLDRLNAQAKALRDKAVNEYNDLKDGN